MIIAEPFLKPAEKPVSFLFTDFRARDRKDQGKGKRLLTFGMVDTCATVGSLKPAGERTWAIIHLRLQHGSYMRINFDGGRQTGTRSQHFLILNHLSKTDGSYRNRMI
jgi:hypothetical protein